MIADINRAWDQLEKSEHERELALREELIRSVVTLPCSCWKRQKNVVLFEFSYFHISVCV